MKTKIAILLFALCSPVFANSALLQKSEQLVIVSTPDWNAAQGSLQRYQRSSTKAAWQKMGTAIPVVIGKNGMAWDSAVANIATTDPIKKEGDSRTPVGVYEVGPRFGFSTHSTKKLDYFPLTNTSVCVDDGKSHHYNQLLDSSKISQKDWDSGEQMREIPQYKQGMMVQYNTHPATPGKGSCIFLHIQKNPPVGTAGCIATDETQLQQVLDWLDRKKHPVMILITKPAYQQMKTQGLVPKDINV